MATCERFTGTVVKQYSEIKLAFAMIKSLPWIALVTCFMLQCHFSLLQGRKEATCEQLCRGLGVSDGCRYAEDTKAGPEEVVVITNGSSDIQAWKWDTISMVVSQYFSSSRNTGYTACYTHSLGKRYGLKEHVPSDMEKLLNSTEAETKKFSQMVVTYQRLLMADHIVYDLLDFFLQLDTQPGLDKSLALSKITDLLKLTIRQVNTEHSGEVYCIVPWKPPCVSSDCAAVRSLLSLCHVLLMSPDSYQPEALDEDNSQCLAQATVPISKFLYGIDRYLSLQIKPVPSTQIVAGIPWHGYAYKCDKPMSQQDGKCVITKTPGKACFSDNNRQKLSLIEIHSSSLSNKDVKMDVVTKGLYYNMNDSAQLWFENFTTLLIKYQLVKDLNLRGLSLWYGEDLAMGLSPDKVRFSVKSWDFMTHNVLHKAVYKPQPISHYYADTVAGVGVGCLLLGTVLGVTFTCIGFRTRSSRKLNRPFKLDEDENAFRDDEGL